MKKQNQNSADHPHLKGTKDWVDQLFDFLQDTGFRHEFFGNKTIDELTDEEIRLYKEFVRKEGSKLSNPLLGESK